MWSNWIGERLKVTKLSLAIVGYILGALVIAILSYWLLQAGTFSMIDKIMNYSPIYESKIEEVMVDFQQFVTENEVKSMDIESIANWNLNYYDYWICVYDENERFYSSKDLWYNLSEFEKIGEFEDYVIHFPDRDTYFALYPLFPYSLVIVIKMLCGFAAAFIFLLMFLVFLRRKLSYVLTISQGVEKMKHGALSNNIDLIGNDELTELAKNINEMSDALAHQLETEKELKVKQTQMIASLSHDLRTPLTMVMSYLELIEDGMYESEEKRREYEQIVYQKASQIKELIEQLFDEVKPKEKVNSKVVNDIMIEKIVNDLVLSFEEEGFISHVCVELEEDFELSIELNDFYRIVDNLYSNILKYADEKSPVDLRMKKQGSYLSFIVSNIIKSETDAVIESHGIGLKSCQDVMSRCCGWLEINEMNDVFEIQCYFPILKKN